MSFAYPFSLVRKPLNIRLSDGLRLVPCLGRLAPLVSAMPWLPARGIMRYQDRLLEFDGHNSQFHALYAPQYAAGYELETCVLLSLLLRGADTFVDAGANWGFFTLMALSLPAFNGRCVSFEPHPRSFADLQSLISQAGMESRVTLHPKGLGSRSCGLRLQGGMSDSGCVRLVCEGEGAEVPVTTLDETVSGDVGVIKMDVEGMEHEVLRGAERLILEQRPFIILENTLDDEAHFRQPIDWLGAKGYRCLVPALFVHSGGTTHLHHYGSPPLNEGARFETDKLAFMPVTERTREWFARQVNLLACPQERLGELPGELHG